MIEIELYTHEYNDQTLYYRVLKQDDGIRRGEGLIFTASNGFTFESIDYPRICPNGICILGTLWKYHACIASYKFNTIEEREEWIDKFTVAFKEFKKHLKYYYKENKLAKKMIFSAYGD